MAKRCIIELPTIRITRPGFDADTATRQQCLLHEDKLFAQPYYQTTVTKPGGSDILDITVPAVTANPLVFTFPIFSGQNRSVWPFPRSYSTGGNPGGYPNIQYFSVRHQVLSSSVIRIHFQLNSNTDNLTSAYVVLFRRPS